MNSDSPPPDNVLRTEMKVLGVLALLLMGVEFGLQLVENRLSIDIQHLQSFGHIASAVRPAAEASQAAIGRGTSSSPSQLLFLGNSMTRYGLNANEFSTALEQRTGSRPDVVALHPDNSRISEWSWLFRNFISERRRAPDLLIVGFARNQLSDAPSKTPDRIARFYGCGLDDVSRLSREDVRGVEDWSSFLLARYSATYANRERVERRILGTLIPAYQETSNLLNDRTMPQELQQADAAATYHRLTDLVQLAQADRVEVVLVALPTQEGYELDGELIQLAREQHITLMDCRNVPGVTADMIPDGLHLTPEGAVHYSRFLATWLPVEPLIARHDAQIIQVEALLPADSNGDSEIR